MKPIVQKSQSAAASDGAMRFMQAKRGCSYAGTTIVEDGL